MFWSEIGSGFGEPGGTPPPRIPRSTPSPLPQGLTGNSSLRTLALIVYAHPYCARNSRRNAMLRHARARVQMTKSVHMKEW